MIEEGKETFEGALTRVPYLYSFNDTAWPRMKDYDDERARKNRLIMRHRVVNAIILFSSFIPLISAKADVTQEDDDGYLKFLGDALDKDAEIRRAEHKHHFEHAAKLVPKPFKLPGDYVPLPGRSSNADYWPLYPMMNQYMAAVTFDTSKGTHMGGDINVPIPDWGFLDIGGHFIERYQDYWAKVGYSNNPINMLGLRKDQIAP
ncbi:hypothetical protein TELCIR_04637 [Teladorsagia circumcincta]|uniref:Uncharacterized protein n=1 Tax=Teladorsagia circumcincta TaxID=45464 RepID=A0A2G9UT27_TELCI|nr:hypothetical protein TELCIR_04637 [Teladorsagia circumcincta]